ncbi:peptidase S41, partial [Streptomyces sp. SID7760]|nr:peptidase S41 [Streptomyces sp. SID7760]
MPGLPAFCLRPRDLRRGAALTLAFIAAVGTAAGTGCWDRADAVGAAASGVAAPA